MKSLGFYKLFILGFLLLTSCSRNCSSYKEMEAQINYKSGDEIELSGGFYKGCKFRISHLEEVKLTGVVYRGYNLCTDSYMNIYFPVNCK